MGLMPDIHFGPQKNFLPSKKILHSTKLKIFPDDKWNVVEMIVSFCGMVDNNVEKGENADYHHFLFFPWCFPKFIQSGLFKFKIVW